MSAPLGSNSVIEDLLAEPLVTPSILRLRPYQAGKPLEELARELGIVDAVKLASNENPVGPSPRALAAATAALSEIHRYPDANAYALRTALAARLGVQADELVFGNGSNELLDLMVRTFTTPNSHLVFAEPSFVVYRMAAEAHGVPFTAVPLKQGVHDLPAMGRAVRDDTRLVFIANPNNPTGTMVTHAELEAFLEALPPRVIVGLDEAYFEYVTDASYPRAFELRRRFPRLVILRTFSKAFGLAALRVGYAVCAPELADYMNRVRAPFNVSSPGQAAALAALDDSAFLQRVVELNTRERERVSMELERLGLRVYPSQANFLLVELGKDASSLYEQLLQHGVIVRPIPPLPGALRVSLGLEHENDRFLKTLKELLA